jgi:hypothetical protein
MANVPAGLYYNPNVIVPASYPNFTATVTTPVLGDLGGGSGVLFLPLIFNWDATMSKFIPIFGERRGLRLQVQAYNVFNHAEFVGLNTGPVQFIRSTDESDGWHFQRHTTSSCPGLLGQERVLNVLQAGALRGACLSVYSCATGVTMPTIPSPPPLHKRQYSSSLPVKTEVA